MNDPNNPCIFCKISKDELQFENELAYSSTDSYPVSKFHILIIPKRHIKNYFELSKNEILACNKIITMSKSKVENEDKTIEGFNLGSNIGRVAGQSVDHCHIHLIPRRKEDVDNPQGGVRAVIPSKQHYVRKSK